ncbi:uncharacterized protein LOC110488542 [Oncorhynchus mykiss]|uniref:uncharacterized protein LOC110488542 n=1 Tax=Oncorhynchus mykiss TaxID=8022 RepID=UPI0018782D0E|nr:uncharacterized protein LOC110488542 [Oncorhynchus mykiss]
MEDQRCRKSPTRWEDQAQTLRIMFLALVLSILITVAIWTVTQGQPVLERQHGTNSTDNRSVPLRDLNNSHSSSSQREAQDRSPANNSRSHIERRRRSMHPLDEHHSRNHEGNTWWSLLNYTVKTELMLGNTYCYVCSLFPHSAISPFLQYSVEVSIKDTLCALEALLSNENTWGQPSLGRTLRDKCINGNLSSTKYLRGGFDCSHWCSRIILEPRSRVPEPIKVQPRRTPFRTCHCHNPSNISIPQLNESYLGMSTCVNYSVFPIGCSWKKGTCCSGYPIRLRVGHTIIDAETDNRSPHQFGSATFTDHYWICGDKVYLYLPTNWTGCCIFGKLNISLVVMHKTNSSIPSRLRLIKRDISQYNNVPSDSRRSSKLERLWRGLIPWYGASENAHELDRLGYHLESLVNLTTAGFSMIRP